ncbi:MAG TPA: toxin-antitoxin system YwqK family antitoxin [Bacteroidia bacterium]|jgi:antitoxin component YwqK of YwqJK toxin-antitoxin module|nr:toxin-antitoxin system YwqK family antitoxin [Bacteroidia bacterium]
MKNIASQLILVENSVSTIQGKNSFSLKHISFFIFLFLFGTQLNAQNLVLKDGLYYASNGSLYSGTYNSYGQNGSKLASITLMDGKKNGPATYYYENGNIKEMGVFLNNEKNEQWLHWDEAGNKIAEAFYVEGKKNGTWMIWDAKGTKRYEMYYSMDKKIGKWSMWNENGQLTSEKLYNNI